MALIVRSFSARLSICEVEALAGFFASQVKIDNPPGGRRAGAGVLPRPQPEWPPGSCGAETGPGARQ